MKTSTLLTKRFSTIIALAVAAGLSLLGAVSARAQCNVAPPDNTSLDLITNLNAVLCADSTTYTWAVNVDPNSSAVSTVRLLQCNYFVPYYNNGSIALTLRAVSAPSSGTQTYTIWSNYQGNVIFSNSAPGLVVNILDNNGSDITGSCTIDSTGFAPAGGDTHALTGTITVTWGGGGGGCTPPALTTVPADQIVTNGGTATYTVVSSDPGATFQWKKNGNNLSDGDTGNGTGATYSGTTSGVLTIANIGAGDAVTSAYSCQVTGTGGTCSTNTAAVSLVIGSGTCSSTNALVSIVDNHNGTFTLNFIGTVGAQYYVATTTDLSQSTSQWSIASGSTTTVVNIDGTWSYTTTANGGSPDQLRFFRSVATLVCP